MILNDIHIYHINLEKQKHNQSFKKRTILKKNHLHR